MHNLAFNLNVIKGRTTFFEQFQGNEKNIISSSEEENNVACYTLRRRKTYLPLIANIMWMQ
jgi:hypothetical protein